ncbi:hypothetical protein PBCV1_A253R [Paramecium bursaria Chlorella virus 1]|uniref:Uncharacterized protein n=1 Tax=Paramecium bursaria Chlorella virus 1 TaxID=10506 RepID=Q84570_PBCV1|nr:hypothetical protein PBCV1_A253R [Paramecium bursaria Chlorella virus 1]AAC96621.1 hypothetical protein [Paramecium bursaria Chlorella virus 1]
MSTMAQIMSQPIFAYNQNKVNEIRNCVFHHPVTEPVETPKVFVLDDEGWKVYKNMLARIAKERKTSKEKKTKHENKKCIRDHRDESFVPIEFSVNDPVVRICTNTFSITKFRNFEDAVDGYHNVAKNDVVKAIKGEISDYDGYYWIPTNK